MLASLDYCEGLHFSIYNYLEFSLDLISNNPKIIFNTTSGQDLVIKKFKFKIYHSLVDHFVHIEYKFVINVQTEVHFVNYWPIVKLHLIYHIEHSNKS
jgi:hypothetical protein